MKSHGGVRSIVVLGVGNTIMQDDGVGVLAVRALAQNYDLPPHVRLIQGGVAGLGLLWDLERADDLLIIDAVDGTGPPGTLYRFGPQNLPKTSRRFISAHDMGMAEVLSMMDLLGKQPHTRIIGIQPLENRKMGLELTPLLREALPRVVAAVVEELQALGVEVLGRKEIRHA